MDRKVLAAVICAVLVVPVVAGAWWYQADMRPDDPNPAENDDISANLTSISANIILGRPTDRSVTANVLAVKGMEAYIEFGKHNGTYADHTGTVPSAEGGPIVLTVDGLLPDTRYFYRLRARMPNETTFAAGAEHSFHTQRSRTSSFVFDIEADPHLDEQTDLELFNITLRNIIADRPDLMFDLGDTFMTDKLPSKDRASIEERYLLLRSFFNRTCADAPLFLVQGNHDGEQGWENDGTPNCLAAMSAGFRKEYYPNPTPDSFDSNYYSFEWGNALFVVLDPYWFTSEKPAKSADNWDWTLGKVQYDWFRGTLQNSTARFKFVFCHQVVGGADKDGRGGIEVVPYYEMGGKNADGSWGFDQHRPGWGKPLHQLMVDNNVSAFFHGHDHFFDRQVLDGVVYQECPQPGHVGETMPGQASQYGYLSGDIKAGSGHVSVTINGSSATVDFVRARLPSDTAPGPKNGEVAFSYLLD
jgi:hypothetical protein